MIESILQGIDYDLRYQVSLRGVYHKDSASLRRSIDRMEQAFRRHLSALFSDGVISREQYDDGVLYLGQKNNMFNTARRSTTDYNKQNL